MPPAAVALALALGASALPIAGCGSSSGLIPAAKAEKLEEGFKQIAALAEAGHCTRMHEALELTETQVQSLEASTDRRLRARIEEGLGQLRSLAQKECTAQSASTTTSTTSRRTTTSTPVVTQFSETTTSTQVSTQSSEAPPTSSSAAGSGGAAAPEGNEGEAAKEGSGGGAEGKSGSGH